MKWRASLNEHSFYFGQEISGGLSHLNSGQREEANSIWKLLKLVVGRRARAFKISMPTT